MAPSSWLRTRPGNPLFTISRDRGGDRTGIVHPDGAWFATAYDGLDRPFFIANAASPIAMAGRRGPRS